MKKTQVAAYHRLVEMGYPTAYVETLDFSKLRALPEPSQTEFDGAVRELAAVPLANLLRFERTTRADQSVGFWGPLLKEAAKEAAKVAVEEALKEAAKAGVQQAAQAISGKEGTACVCTGATSESKPDAEQWLYHCKRQFLLEIKEGETAQIDVTSNGGGLFDAPGEVEVYKNGQKAEAKIVGDARTPIVGPGRIEMHLTGPEDSCKVTAKIKK